jgi:hypothetical protein
VKAAAGARRFTLDVAVAEGVNVVPARGQAARDGHLRVDVAPAFHDEEHERPADRYTFFKDVFLTGSCRTRTPLAA